MASLYSQDDARQLLSNRGFQAQAERGWGKVIDVISNLYDEKTNPDGYISLGLAENVCDMAQIQKT
jgi:hypothetical protein